MRVTIDLENLESIVQTTLEKNSEEAIHRALESVVQKEVDKALKSDIDKAVSEIVEDYIRDYLKTAKVQVGNSWSGDGVKEYTVEDYLKSQVAEIFDKQAFTVKSKDSWGGSRSETVSFQEYVKNQIDIESYIKKDLDRLAKDIKTDVNIKIKSAFDDSMRRTLADNVFSIVSASETYQKVQSSLSLLGG